MQPQPLRLVWPSTFDYSIFWWIYFRFDRFHYSNLLEVAKFSTKTNRSKWSSAIVGSTSFPIYIVIIRIFQYLEANHKNKGIVCKVAEQFDSYKYENENKQQKNCMKTHKNTLTLEGNATTEVIRVVPLKGRNVQKKCDRSICYIDWHFYCQSFEFICIDISQRTQYWLSQCDIHQYITSANTEEKKPMHEYASEPYGNVRIGNTYICCWFVLFMRSKKGITKHHKTGKKRVTHSRRKGVCCM